jgi:hypothetical protein
MLPVVSVEILQALSMAASSALRLLPLSLGYQSSRVL